nr:zinc ABC transporter substrate-binding protein [Veronia pacifica]
MSCSALASAPKVAVDIAPVHSLVAQVMEGVGQPDLLIRPEASPHDYSLKPSEARALSQADIVFWMSEGLTPWLEKPLDTLASKAVKVEMLEVAGTTTYEFREGATFEAHDHHDEEGHHDDEGHHAEHKDDHHDDDHHKDEHHKKDEHHAKHKDDHHEKDGHHDDDHHDKKGHHEKEGHHAKHDDDHHGDGHEGHNHEGEDPHAWLDPVNAKVWVKKISEELIEHDPKNKAAYESNTEKTLARLDRIIANIDQETKKLDKVNFIVFHDAYQYFERRFGVEASGAISIGDAQDPSPARVAEIRDLVKKLNITCVFSEPQYNPGLINSVFEGTSVKNIGVMDPLGANIGTGKDQYEKLLDSMVNSLVGCSS